MVSVLEHTSKEPATETELVPELRSTIDLLQKEIRLLREQVEYLLRHRFSPHSERFNPDQGVLFDELPDVDKKEDDDAETQKISYTRKKGGRSKPPAHLPRVRVEHDLPETDKQCQCGADLIRIGEEISEQYDVIPPVFRVLQNVRHKYACPCCNHGMRIADAPPVPLPRHQVSPSFLAWLGTGKFVDGLPLYRQAKILEKRFGIPFNRTTLADLAIKAADFLLKPLIAAMELYLLQVEYLHIDETTMQVLDEKDRQAWQKSYLWLRATGVETPVVLLNYSASRAMSVANELLDGFSGYLHTDGYAGYNDAGRRNNVNQLGCWAHVRRKFDVAAKNALDNTAKTHAKMALSYIQKLYRIEQRIKKKPPDEKQRIRAKDSRVVLDEFRAWVDSTLAIAESQGGKLKIAYTYLLNQWSKLIVFLQDGRLRLDNNKAESHIRPIAQGRKQWLFAQSEAGAHATAAWYYVVETAKANGWEPYHYLKKIFTELPVYLNEGKPLDDLLPWNLPPEGVPK